MDEKFMFWSPCVGLRPFVKPKKGELVKFRPASFEKNVQKSAPHEAAVGAGVGLRGGGCVGGVGLHSGSRGRVGRRGASSWTSVSTCYIYLYIFIYIYIN